MKLPGHATSVEDFNRVCYFYQGLTLEQIDLIHNRKRFFKRTMQKYTDDELSAELTDRGFICSKEPESQAVTGVETTTEENVTQ